MAIINLQILKEIVYLNHSSMSREDIRRNLMKNWDYTRVELTRKVLNSHLHRLVISKDIQRITNERGTKPRWLKPEPIVEIKKKRKLPPKRNFT